MSTVWKQRREGGGSLALRLFLGLTRLVGRGAARLLLYPITLYFLLRRGAERRGSRAYLSRILGRPATLPDVARHFHTFAATILDRPFLLMGDMRRFDIAITGLEDLHRQLDRGRGVLVFGSHLGSFEVLRVLALRRPGGSIRVVLDKAHSAALTRLLDALNPGIAATVIDAGQDGPSIMLQIQQAMAEGAMVALLVDRAQPGGAAVRVPFLGEPAAFPVAPWLVAAALQAPVTLAFGLYRGGSRYGLVFESFSDGIAIPRGERAAAVPALIRRYAARLEHHARAAPFNWFNFYDFWDDREYSANETSRSASRPAAPAPGVAVDGVAGGAGAAFGGATGDRAARR